MVGFGSLNERWRNRFDTLSRLQTHDQVLEWCGCHNIGNTTLVINRWLRTQWRASLFGVTNRKIDRNGTPGEFEAFQESEKASEIKGS